MKILVTGSTGMIGTALIKALSAKGHQIIRVVRKPLPSAEPAVHWDPNAGKFSAAEIEGMDAVVHLAGEIIAGLWTAAKKAKIRDSRIKGTRLLAETLARLTKPPKVLVCASAIGYYGDRGDEILREDSGPGTGFLSEVCVEWEKATGPAAQKGTRVVNTRFGLVLSKKGGALATMLLPFKMGVGGVVGSGRQYWSWVAFEDVIGAIQHALTTESLKGPVNVVAPRPVTNREFTKTLGQVLSRPTIFPLPAFAARLVLGEMAEALLLASACVDSSRLVASGYKFRHSELESALRFILGKS